jgi:hypothetical protein
MQAVFFIPQINQNNKITKVDISEPPKKDVKLILQLNKRS